MLTALWSDSNFIPVESKIFEFRSFNRVIKIYIENEPESLKMRSRDFRIFRNFSIKSFETLTRFCENTVICIEILTGVSERTGRDLVRLVL